MSHKIHILSPLVANQIAAGEVVERPASVVKELVENSLDASSTRIQIDIEQGGTKLIQVRDDGFGIAKEDLALALSRHATSKIHDASDLQAILSLGFRGEALASISSVSRLTMTSCAAKASSAWMSTTQGEQLTTTLTPASHPVGTTVTVRDLFFNTPARRKFLRAERTEYQHIEDLVRQFILSRFDVGFMLRHQQRLVFNVRPAMDEASQRQRLALIMGHDFVKDAKVIQKNCDNMTLHGWIGTHNTARSSTDRQFFYVNGRIVRDKLILHGVRQAYENFMPEGRCPSYVLFLEVPAQKVDVNVHPTKHEVRFHESRQVHDFLVSAIQSALAVDTAPEYPQAKVLQMATSFQPMQHFTHTGPSNSLSIGEEKKSPWGEPVGMLGARYLLAISNEQLHVVDVNRAKRHVAYHRLMSVLSGATLKAQPLLIPKMIEVTRDNGSVLSATLQRLRTLMIDIDTLGPSTLVIRKLPCMLQECQFSDAMKELLQQSSLSALIVILCQHIHSLGHPLSKEEQRVLLMDLAQVNWVEQLSLYGTPVMDYSLDHFNRLFAAHESTREPL